MDELLEFDRKVLEVLREPLENGEVHISRARGQVTIFNGIIELSENGKNAVYGGLVLRRFNL